MNIRPVVPTASIAPPQGMRAEVLGLFPAGVAGAEMFDFAHAEPLFAEEEGGVARAVEKRRLEFRAGRTCARRSLVALGFEPGAIVMGRDRAPEWPDGVVGSITHTKGYCAAVVGKAGDFAGLGVDAEAQGRVGPELWAHIARPEEIGWLQRARDDPEASVRATLLFSAKEALYKAQYPVTRAWLGFHDVRVTFEGEKHYTVELSKDVDGLGSAGARFRGRWLVSGGLVVTGLAIARAPGTARG